jgi:RNA recognition motif-containing protein
MFAPHGAVRSAEVISDRETGRSRGFGFVEMETDEGLQAAISALNGHEVNGRPLTVNEARERTPRAGGGGGGGYGGGGGGGGGRGGYGGGGGGGRGGYGGGRGGYGGGDRY